MHTKTTMSHDGITLHYAISSEVSGRPWIALIIPFGLNVALAEHFFSFFESQYNVVSLESRTILERTNREAAQDEFAMENHVEDLRTVLKACQAERFILIGYCSGAGIALAAANRYPQLFSNIVLVHGEYTMLSEKECTTQFAVEIDSLLSLAAKGKKYSKLVFQKIKDERITTDVARPDGIDMPFTRLSFLRRYAANYLAYKSVDFKKLAKFVTNNTLLLSGARDVQANVKSTERIAELIPNAEIYIDPEADHYGILRDDSNTLITIWNYLCEQRAYIV